MNEKKGADIEADFLWFACELSDSSFQPVYEELLALCAESRCGGYGGVSRASRLGLPLCGSPTPASLRGLNYAIERPDPKFPDIEHVIPLSPRGPHFYGNLRLAHRPATNRRGARMTPRWHRC